MFYSASTSNGSREIAGSPELQKRLVKRHHFPYLGVALVLFTATTARFGPNLWQLLQDEQALESTISELGWLGPAALIGFNIVQIVVAPIPGYVVQIASGYLFGPIWGGLWASIGLLVGAMLSMWLARTFGRPLVERLVGGQRLDRWETTTHSDSAIVWFILILSPTGDLPYFLAGLSSTRFLTIFLLSLAIRVPTTFVVTSAGAGVMLLNWWQLTTALAALIVLLLAFMRYQERIVSRIDQYVHRRMS
jgi:uncharacterized membrane protein YdjX (TVP38/TMEM64 family)